jgi:lipoprotein-anchoring transpeptidase ErfK/SrfK
MQRIAFVALLASATGMATASAQPMQISPAYQNARATAAAAAGPAPEPQATQVRYNAPAPDLGGGFIEFLFGGGIARPRYQDSRQLPLLRQPDAPAPMYVHGDPAGMSPARPAIDPRYLKQVVAYHGNEKPGTIIIDTPSKHLFLVQEDGKAIRYGIGVGRPGFTWAGVKTVSQMREWPDWRPPEEMLRRRPDLPTYMAGGPNNPLGARALYLGSSLYRIHGSNEPWTIGTAVSSGCIRMRNEDVIDLYDKVKVGTKVVVI